MSKIKNILIIDDNEDDRVLYERSLLKSDSSYVVHEAQTGDEGLSLIEETNPDCVLLDYSLPGHNGIEVLKKIRTKHQFLPVVMLTGQGNEAIAVSAMQEGAQDYITKSDITSESLNRVTQVAIRQCSLQRRINEQRISLEIFTHALAHDLKEPARTILSYLELIEDKASLSQRSQDYFQNIKSAAQRMTRLIDTVYLYTRLDAADKMKIEMCDTKKLAEEAINNLHQLIKESNAVVKIGALQNVYGNQTHFIQLFQNLISNAIKHNSDKVEITVGSEDKGDHWQFYVQDNGSGINVDDLNKIFEPFQRFSGNNKKGLGMGLAICKKIVDSLEGNMWCKSKPGEGATFFFSIPKKKNLPKQKSSDAVSKDSIPEIRSSNSNKTANILLVDDNKMDIELSKIMLFEQPNVKCNIYVAGDGQEALEIMRSSLSENNPVDFVMLDINMPRMNGFECLEVIRKDKGLKDTPVVICSTSSYDKDEQRAEALGISGYIVKPARFDMMQQVIQKIPTLVLSKTDGSYNLLRA